MFVPKPLKILMEQSFESGTLPLEWRSAVVKPIYKKGDKFVADNYRPVSLTSHVVKIAESIVYDALIEFMINCNIIPTEQHGFVPGRSVTTNLLCSLEDWTKTLDSGESTDVLYLDFSKAFDRVPLRHLLLKLNHFGVRGNLLRWIEAFLSNRLFSVKVGDVFSMQRRVLSGVPQGSVLGPLLFVIYTSDIKYSLKSPFVMYADDLKIYNKSCNFTVLQNDLDVVANWSCTWLLPINSAKCVVLYTNSSRNPKHDYHVNGTQLFKVDSYRNLGVMVSSSVLWSEHIAEVVKKANRIIFLISRTFRAITISML